MVECAPPSTPKLCGKIRGTANARGFVKGCNAPAGRRKSGTENDAKLVAPIPLASCVVVAGRVGIAVDGITPVGPGIKDMPPLVDKMAYGKGTRPASNRLASASHAAELLSVSAAVAVVLKEVRSWFISWRATSSTH